MKPAGPPLVCRALLCQTHVAPTPLKVAFRGPRDQRYLGGLWPWTCVLVEPSQGLASFLARQAQMHAHPPPLVHNALWFRSFPDNIME